MLVFGLVSSLHCVTMCGPIIAVASAPLTHEARGTKGRWRSLVRWQGAYHLGRGLTYVTIGAILAWAGTTLGNLFAARTVGGLIQLGVGAAIIGLALYCIILGKAVSAPAGNSRFGRLLRRQVTSGHGLGMFSLGALTGLLPCGVLYVAFARSVAAGSVLEGAALMFAFWLGSAPLLAAVGVFSGGLLRLSGRYVTVVLAAVMLTTGGWLLYKGYENLTSSPKSCCHPVSAQVRALNHLEHPGTS